VGARVEVWGRGWRCGGEGGGVGAEDKSEMLVKGPHVIVEKTENP
jgi:hypothetical protein